MVCASGTSGFSGSSDFTTSTITCPLPTGLTATSITTTSALLSWTAAAGATSYAIEYRVTGTSGWSYTSSSSTSVTLSGLSPATTYEFEVQSVCSASDSSGYTISTLFTTVSTGTSCPIPAGLFGTSLSPTSELLNWGVASGAVNYNILYRAVSAPSWNTTTSSTNSVTITGLVPATNYEFEVQSVCSSTSLSDTSNYSALVGFITQTGSGVANQSIAENSFTIYPNPVTQSANIMYSLTAGENVTVCIYDMVGREIKEIVTNEPQQAGPHNYDVMISAPGVYFVKLTAGHLSITKKVVKL